MGLQSEVVYQLVLGLYVVNSCEVSQLREFGSKVDCRAEK